MRSGISHEFLNLPSSCFFTCNLEALLRTEKVEQASQMVKNLPAMQETLVQSLGWKDPLEKEMAIHSRILAWRILWAEEPGGLQSIGHKESDMTEQPTLSFFQEIGHFPGVVPDT